MKKLIIWIGISILIIAGCSQKESTTSPVSENQVNDALFPITIEHAGGSTTIPERPERIVEVAYAADYFKALEVPLLGSTAIDWTGTGNMITAPYLDLQGVEAVPMVDYKPNLEQILALKPDLIVALVDQKDQYDKLNKIAPTILLDLNQSDWRTVFKIIAKSVGKLESADNILKKLDAQIQKAQQEVTMKDAVWVHGTFSSDKQIALGGPLSYADIVYKELNISPSSIVPKGWTDMVSKEAFIDADPETIFIYSPREPEKILETWKKDALFGNLKAVKNNRVILLEQSYWENPGPISIEKRLQDILNQ
ncbi:ABC transporter substrate-binding protein [Paenibacillus harenae]|uniref:Iron complex transport system substrate-binding protein n=1 Tax=Paenibacillus harenae TaxID=306543 RepID=A0ABT9U6N1_PAEHA|nr:ABC transporter substrate-binding protein [Paenibacillus harenae]MDQ0114104.1 iron complex transport system substrate-binding protein [Paenibacillus harenae]